MSIKESPIKQNNSNCTTNKNYDMSYMNKDFNVTPKSNKFTHFSPTTPVSDLNTLMMQSHTPNEVVKNTKRDNQFNCEFNYLEDDNEDNQNSDYDRKPKDSAKTHTPDIRGPSEEVEHIIQKQSMSKVNNGKRSQGVLVMHKQESQSSL